MLSADVRALRWSGCVHDIGELIVPVTTWMRNGPLSVRERALASFGREGEPMAALVLRHYERLDGSGYHRKVGGSDLSPAARILAAADHARGTAALQRVVGRGRGVEAAAEVPRDTSPCSGRGGAVGHGTALAPRRPVRSPE